MKEIFSGLVAVILVAAPAGAATLECHIDNLQIDPLQQSIRCDGWGTIVTEQGISIPVREFFIELSQNESATDIVYSSVDSSTPEITSFLPAASGVTAIASRYDGTELLRRSFNGSNVVTLLGEVNRGGRRFARVMVSPVTVTEGHVILHRTIALTLSSREIPASELIPVDDLSMPQVFPSAAADGGSPKYVIVTSRQLLPALEPLRRYKNETGYTAETMAIEDISASYSGRDEAERLRNFLKDFYATGGTYVLLAGDETVLPIRYAYDYTNHADTALPLEDLQICDLYFADLTGDWNRDNDQTWGERLDDAPDFAAELVVGRLPFNLPEEFATYTTNLIRYQTAPGAGDPGYLSRSFFYSSDQMRDLNDGQHNRIAEAFPPGFEIDTAAGVEAARGDDPAPSNLSPAELAPVLEEGYGIINILAHGRVDGFVLKSSNYNEWPKTFMLTDPGASGHGSMAEAVAAGKPSLYVSLACDNAAFDGERLASSPSAENLCEDLLSLADGAVGFVGYTRWGWVGSSYILQQAFFDSLFAQPDRPASEALDCVKAAFPYYRDMIYGLNYFGDPSLRVFASVPQAIKFTATASCGGINIQANAGNQPLSDCHVILSLAGAPIAAAVTDQSGSAEIFLPPDSGLIYTLSLVKPGYIIARGYLTGSIATDVEDGTDLPRTFSLSQNYPNPFNPNTTIGFDLPAGSLVSLSIYNMWGQEVRALVGRQVAAGHHAVMWDGTDNSGQPVASGPYFYRLTAAGFVQTRKMILLK